MSLFKTAEEQLMEKKAYIINSMISGLIKEASREYGDRNPGYFAKRMATSRATRAGDSGAKQLAVDKELIKSRLYESLKGAGIGAGVGAGVGAGAGALIGILNKNKALGAGIGAGVGGMIGLAIGDEVGTYSADKNYLKARGITLRGQGYLSPDMTDEAKSKYLHRKYRGGGYGS